jgi:hypothetical protein
LHTWPDSFSKLSRSKEVLPLHDLKDARKNIHRELYHLSHLVEKQWHHLLQQSFLIELFQDPRDPLKKLDLVLMILAVQHFQVLDGLQQWVLKPLGMNDIIHLTAQLGILVKHGPDHRVELRLKALQELPQLPC